MAIRPFPFSSTTPPRWTGTCRGGGLPLHYLEPVLAHPLGLLVVPEDAKYVNPNGFFGQWPFYQYFNEVPPLLQRFASPVDSVYLAVASAKTPV